MPHEDQLQEDIQNPDNLVSDQEIIQKIDADNEEDYLKALKEKNKEFLVTGLSDEERKRIGDHICTRLIEAEGYHSELSDRIDEWNEVYLMKRKEIPGSTGDVSNYRSGTTTVAMEVLHANVMNVFFTPRDTIRTLPTEEGDVGKIKKMDTFANWSGDNELNLFENLDRLFHNSEKTGESPCIVHWVKEYGVDIVRDIVRNPAKPSEPLIDPDTKQPIFQERDEPKLLYNGPKLEPFSRKDYIQPENAIMDKQPDWEARIMRMTFNDYLKDQMQGKMYPDTLKAIQGWGTKGADSNKDDTEGDNIPLGEWEKEFHQWFGTLRINVIKKEKEDKTIEMEELEKEYIAIVHKKSKILCQLRENKLPLKLRPIVVDYLIPDDDGRRKGIGVPEFLDGIQKAYDVLYNQYITGVTASNSPIIFYTPNGNQRREPMKINYGFMYATADPKSVNIWRLPPPDTQINIALELITQWAQLLFGISDFTAGVESRLDPTGPAKKAEISVAQGNVRMNLIIKRKNRTVQEIFKRWYLLYKENMPKHKFMRIAGNTEEEPFKFDAITLEDFALNAIPDFEFTGNILNSNKALEANKKIAIYDRMIANPLFSPQTTQGLKLLGQLTKWLADGLDDTGFSKIIPEQPGDIVQTPEEENARFLQGDTAKPLPKEDHIHHIRTHEPLLNDQTLPEQIRKNVAQHIADTFEMMQQEHTQQIALQQGQQGGGNPQQPNTVGGGGNGNIVQGENNQASEVFQRQPAGLG